ncbi:MAG: hypothetical protein AB2693_34145, partial [Candidatus Thiodiazotropha sp.]
MNLLTPVPAVKEAQQLDSTPLITEQPEIISQLNSFLLSLAGVGQEPQDVEKPVDLTQVPDTQGAELPLDLCLKVQKKTATQSEGNHTEVAANHEQGLKLVDDSAPADEGEAYPTYTPTPIERNEAESPIPRQEEDILDLADDNMSISTPTKRSRDTKDEAPQETKKPREESLPVDIRDLSERTLVDMVGKALTEMEKTRRVQEGLMKAMVDVSCVQSKLADEVG